MTTSKENLRAGSDLLKSSFAGLRGNSADALAIASIQQQCRDITKTDLSKCKNKADVDAALLAAWGGVLSKAPASVIQAFGGLSS
jgi:hypothetical protein